MFVHLSLPKKQMKMKEKIPNTTSRMTKLHHHNTPNKPTTTPDPPNPTTTNKARRPIIMVANNNNNNNNNSTNKVDIHNRDTILRNRAIRSNSSRACIINSSRKEGIMAIRGVGGETPGARLQRDCARGCVLVYVVWICVCFVRPWAIYGGDCMSRLKLCWFW